MTTNGFIGSTMFYAVKNLNLRALAKRFDSCDKSVALVFVAGCLSLLFSSQAYSQTDTLSRTINRGVVKCGVSEGLKGFSSANSLGDYSGLDADFCRAVASAIFNDPDAVEFVALNSKNRFNALTSGDVDLLVRNTTWTLFRNVEYGEFIGVNYYDGQGFMVPKTAGIRSALELDSKGICVIKETTTELNAIDFFIVSKMRYKPIYFETNQQIKEAYEAGRCAAMTTDRSGLAAIRATLSNPDAHRVLPEIISKEPLGPVVRSGDSQWANVVRWSLNCMINAEELGVTSDNVTNLRDTDDPTRARLLGTSYEFGSLMGISNQWCSNIITHIGNYGESYERNVGENTTLGLARGVNRLWTDGGLLYAPPIR